MLTIVQAKSTEQIRQAQELFAEYIEWLRTDIDTALADLNDVPALTGYKDEIAGLPGKYAAPEGRLLLAHVDGEIAGCAALYKIRDSVCEVKRVWVRPRFRGKQIGKVLVETLIEEARKVGYTSMILSTVDV